MSSAHRHLSLAVARTRILAGIRARKRRRALLASGAALTVALSAALSLASFTGADLAGAAVQRAQSFLELMHKRSPGKRTEARLTKFRHVEHRVLAERSPAPPPPIVVPEYVPDVGLVAPSLPVPAAFFPQGPVLAQIPPPLFYSPPPGVAIVPPPQPPHQPPPPPPIPEPGTWMLLLAGFGLSGWMLRRDGQMKRVAAG
jgi:hypothetical protein